MPHLLRHQRYDPVLQELARVYVVDALKRREPRVVVTSVKSVARRQDGENVLAMQYKRAAQQRPAREVKQTIVVGAYRLMPFQTMSAISSRSLVPRLPPG
jgi:phage baseplate assembly protein W